jgi:hypothetical protein
MFFFSPCHLIFLLFIDYYSQSHCKICINLISLIKLITH